VFDTPPVVAIRMGSSFSSPHSTSTLAELRDWLESDELFRLREENRWLRQQLEAKWEIPPRKMERTSTMVPLSPARIPIMFIGDDGGDVYEDSPYDDESYQALSPNSPLSPIGGGMTGPSMIELERAAELKPSNTRKVRIEKSKAFTVNYDQILN
jgi:hypothetical protein